MTWHSSQFSLVQTRLCAGMKIAPLNTARLMCVRTVALATLRDLPEAFCPCPLISPDCFVYLLRSCAPKIFLDCHYLRFLFQTMFIGIFWFLSSPLLTHTLSIWLFFKKKLSEKMCLRNWKFSRLQFLIMTWLAFFLSTNI